jgi:hypothetical protein
MVVREMERHLILLWWIAKKVAAHFCSHIWSSNKARCMPAAQDSSSTPTRRTRGGSTSVPSYRTRAGSSMTPSYCTRGGSSSVPPAAHRVGQLRVVARPALQSFLRQIPRRRKRYNFTLFQKSHLRWWTCATTPTKWLKVLDGFLRITSGRKPRTNDSNQDLGISFSKLSIATTNTCPWNCINTGL